MLLLSSAAGSRAAPAKPRIPSAQPTAREFAHARFSHPLRIDKGWAPLVAGEKSVLTGAVREGRRVTAHRIVSIVTDLYKMLDGVRTRVIWERDYSAGKLAESELFFVAQDDSGTVWLFGEYPEIYHAGRDLPFTFSSMTGRRYGRPTRPSASRCGALVTFW